MVLQGDRPNSTPPPKKKEKIVSIQDHFKTGPGASIYKGILYLESLGGVGGSHFAGHPVITFGAQNRGLIKMR